MSSLLLSVLLATTTILAYPIHKRRCDLWQTWPAQVFSYDPTLAHVRFSFPCQGCFSPQPATTTNDEFLVFDAYLLNQCDDLGSRPCSKLILNDHEIATASPQAVEDNNGQAWETVSILAHDTSDARHHLTLVVQSNVTANSQHTPTSLISSIVLQRVDGQDMTEKSFTITFLNLSTPEISTRLTDTATGGMVDLRFGQSSCSTLPPDDSNDDLISEEAYIAHEIETIRLLGQDVQKLQHEITARKNAASVRLAEYHARVPLEDLMQHCDGIICRARAIANRLYEKLTLVLDNGYNQLQTPMSQANSTSLKAEQSSNATKEYHSLPSNDFKPMNHPSTDFILQALTYLASVLGLATLFAYLRKKCMSVRSRAERAADREERRNARAYRRAARRAEICRRWSALTSFFTVCRSNPTLSTADYDEKRALILQDALLEEHPEQLERGDIMEAEIRQLRHAHSIIAGMARQTATKTQGMVLNKDPPPTLVPLPYSIARSRSSTYSLPSYSSDALPDYTSLPDEVEGDIEIADGFAHYEPAASQCGSEDPSMPSRTSFAQGTTPISSVAGLSPRASAETLRTRTTVRSRAGSCDFPDL